MGKLFSASALTLVIAASASPGYAADNSSVNERIAKLEEEIQLLKRQVEVKDEVAQTKSEKSASVELSKSGLTIASPDKNFVVKAGGYAQFDARTFFNDRESNATNNQGNGTDQIIARRLRPVLTGSVYKDFSFRFMPDFGGNTVRIVDAYVDYHALDSVNFRFGKFKPPTGLERLQSDADTFFVERGDSSNLTPDRDLGVELFGDIIPETLEYQIGVFNGSPDNENQDSDTDDNKDFAARIFAQPFHKSNIAFIRGIGVGVGGIIGDHEGTAANSGLTTGIRTPGQSNFFTFAPAAGATFADGEEWRLVPQAYWYYNSLGLLGEYTISSENVRNGNSRATLQNHAWQVDASYLLTGEDATYKGSVKPANNFDPLHGGGWGAFEVAARVGQTHIDNDAFPIFSNPATSASSSSTVGAGLNWYLNENVKLMSDYEYTEFKNGYAGGNNRDAENVLLTRLQFRL